MNSIFVQIASYRDPELVHTIRDCIKNAEFPENLKFCIAWHHEHAEDLSCFRDDERIEIIDIPYQESQGCCWARNLIQKRYGGEKFTLQIDSHLRFAKHWDTTLVGINEDLKRSGHAKPLITTYLQAYTPGSYSPETRRNVPTRMVFDRFTPEGAVFFLPGDIPNWEKLTAPVPARFFSAHFCFTDGSFCNEVPHDPDYYFHGEEISIAARAFTHGYDLFHPHVAIAWHEYTRVGRVKQWEDDASWFQRDRESHLRNRKLFGMDGEADDIDFGRYGFGKQRSLRDYEMYAGLCFKSRSIDHSHTDPEGRPGSMSREHYESWSRKLFNAFKYPINIHESQLPDPLLHDVWCITFSDGDGKEITRLDAHEAEIKNSLSSKNGEWHVIWREFHASVQPKGWLVWPHCRDRGWLPKITGVI